MMKDTQKITLLQKHGGKEKSARRLLYIYCMGHLIVAFTCTYATDVGYSFCIFLFSTLFR